MAEQLQRLVNALRNAEVNGRTEDARLLARELRRVQQDMTPAGFPPGPRGESVGPQGPRPSLPAVAVSGAIDTLTLPIELATSADRALTGKPIPRPLFGKERATDLAKSVGLPVVKRGFQPEGSAEELTFGAGLGLGMIPAMKVLKRGVGKRLGAFIDPTGGRPVIGSAVVAASTGASVVGARIGRESAEEHGKNVLASEITAALFFGAGPAVLGQVIRRGSLGLLKATTAVGKVIPGVTGRVVEGLENGVKNLFSTIQARLDTGLGRFKAAERLKVLSGDPRRDAALIEPGGGEFGQPGVVQTGNIRLMRLLQDILDNDNVLSDFHAAATRQRALDLVEAFLEPAGGASAVDAQSFIGQQRAIAEGLIELRLAQAEALTAQRVFALAPTMKESASSLIAKQEIQSALDAVRVIERQAWELVDPALVGGATNSRAAYLVAKGGLSSSTMDDLPTVATARLRPRGIGDNRPPPGMEIAGEKAPVVPQRWGAKVTVKELRGLMSRLREDARKARALGEGNKARIADDIADAVLRDLEAIKDVSEPLGLARKVSKDVRANFFRRGNIARILGTTKTGGESIPGAMALASAMGGRGASVKVGFDEITAALAAGAAARKAAGVPPVPERGFEAIEDFLKMRFAALTSPHGKFLPDQAENFLRNNYDMLSAPKLANLTRDIRQVIKTGRLSDDMQALVQKGLLDAKRSTGATFAKAKFGQAFNDILSAGSKQNVRRAAQILAKTASTDPTGKASRGLTSSLLFHLIDAGSKGGELSGKAMFTAFTEERVQAIARVFLKPKEIKRLGKLIRIITNEELMRGKLPSIGGVFDDAPNTIIRVIVQLFAAQSGTRASQILGKGDLIMPSVMSRLGTGRLQALTVDKARDALAEAVFDNELLSTLLLPFDAPGAARKIERVWGPFFAGQTGRVVGEVQRESGQSPQTSPTPPPRPPGG